jgi:hypothetical protein
LKIQSVGTAALAKLFWLAVLVLGVCSVGAQLSTGPTQRIGLPEDWSHRHIIFSRPALYAYPGIASLEPRALHQWLRQNTVRPLGPNAAPQVRLTDHKRDWSVFLGGGRVAAGMWPAKYGFNPAVAPSCANDYVVYGLNVGGSATQANLIAFNQLYSGTGGLCSATGPSVLFSYNVSTIGGRISTSPILSLDGSKVAVVETTGGSAVLHIVTWKTGLGNGTSATLPAVPGVGNSASMVNITLPGASVTRSSPWIDFTGDTIYVGNNAGRMFKIRNAFKGAPALVNGGGWPVTVSNRILTGPVLDPVTQKIFVGDSNGTLSAFNSVTPGTIQTLAVGVVGVTGDNILDPPLVDSTNGVVYAVSADDGNSAVLVEASTSTLAQLARVNIGRGSSTGTYIPMYNGAPDNNYYNSPSTGRFLVCGTAANGLAPTLYTLSFTGTILNTTPVSTSQIVANTGARCSPITEFYNLNVGTGTDFFFFGVTTGCPVAGGGGCIMSRQNPGTAPTPVAEAGGTSAIMVDNQSTAPQASSIYFGTLAAPGTAVKLTQSGLQ